MKTTSQISSRRQPLKIWVASLAFWRRTTARISMHFSSRIIAIAVISSSLLMLTTSSEALNIPSWPSPGFRTCMKIRLLLISFNYPKTTMERRFILRICIFRLYLKTSMTSSKRSLKNMDIYQTTKDFYSSSRPTWKSICLLNNNSSKVIKLIAKLHIFLE